jgi:putative NADPH-quinone reductase
MSKRILIIDGHPDSQAGRYVHALSKAYFDGARLGGHEVRSIILSETDFPLKSLQRNILRFCGFRPVNACVVGMVEGMSQAQRGEWLAKVQELGVRGK